MNLKDQYLEYFRNGISSTINEGKTYNDKKEASKLVNKKMKELYDLLKDETIESDINKTLMLNYTYYVVMLEARNSVWPYDNMSFSRRIGEIWEPFCKIPFSFNSYTKFYNPPTFEDFKTKFDKSVVDKFIEEFNLTIEGINELKNVVNKIWSFSESGAINLKEDLHFEHGGKKYVVDFKSGFGSNEKGNVNRLLLVAKIYSELKYPCLLFVRQEENNSYLKVIENSGLWKVYRSDKVYDKIFKLTSINLKEWMDINIDWKNDISVEFKNYLETNDLIQYLTW